MAKYYDNYYSSRTVEMTVLSGEDLRLARKSVKKNTFVVVRSDGSNFRTTEMDGGESGSRPNWNEKLVLDLPAHAQAVTLEVHCKTAFGDKIVGTVSVPVADFSGGYLSESGYLHFLSYRLRDSRGEKNGIINVSVRMEVPIPEYTCSASVLAPEQMTVGVPVGKSNFGGVVTGVPVLCAYNNRNF
ncbi:BON1-associated protein 2 [Morus notabilis]|uniref:BON1-associated protein 2 n=1 Tax=Morus notabilis TaxID=981085 RepID=W9RDU3_9ROSA|nr:BON1-associated protein 2 [Morus notabilis]EXB52086.1 BON1-associated protein 2 [Morus notabilis]